MKKYSDSKAAKGVEQKIEDLWREQLYGNIAKLDSVLNSELKITPQSNSKCFNAEITVGTSNKPFTLGKLEVYSLPRPTMAEITRLVTEEIERIGMQNTGGKPCKKFSIYVVKG